MSQQKREKLTATTTTSEKNRPQQPFVQVERKLTQEQLEAIAGGIDGGVTGNHNQSMVSIKEVVMSPPPAKSSQKKSSGQIEGKLTPAQLEAIAAGGVKLN